MKLRDISRKSVIKKFDLFGCKPHFASPAFTIIEILVVIVIIGILASLSLVSYISIARKATEATLQSDLSNSSNQLKLFQAENGTYPDTTDCTIPDSLTNKCIKPSSGNAYSYQSDNAAYPPSFTLYAKNSDLIYKITSDSAILKVPMICPQNFINVPGSQTYGTDDFCVMKYEAKRVGSTTTPISKASGSPWASVSQADAIAYSSNVAGCVGCHLITEAEWLTIAQNVLSVASNWSGLAVGSGYIYIGHIDNVPYGPLSADTNDANGYFNTGNVANNPQRRTLTLTNGEVIWDFSGNLAEWTSGTATVGQPGISGEVGYTWKEYISVNSLGSLLPNVMPASTDLAGAGTWTASSNGIGRLYSNSGETGLRAFLRSGNWNYTSSAGVLSLNLSYAPDYVSGYNGFRVAR